MELKEIKAELERFLGHPVSQKFFIKCLDAFPKARHGSPGFGSLAFMGYYRPFQDALGGDFDPEVVRFFCRFNDYSDFIRKQLLPYRVNFELLPNRIAKTLQELYSNECSSWYRRLAWYFINLGIPEYGVIGILKKHHIPVLWVKHYGGCVGNEPETIAKNILRCRHDHDEYDPLAKPKMRVTKWKIADFRLRLEKELRRIWTDPDTLEETIRNECFLEPDDTFERMILDGFQPETWAHNIQDYL